MNMLHLTPVERDIFNTLPEALREGWTVTHERFGYVDTPARMELRLSLLRIHDPALLALREKAQTAKTMQDAAAAIADLNLSHVNDDDLADLFFALGPDYLSRIIIYLLQQAQTDADVEAIVSIAGIRHSILEAFSTARHA